MRNVSTSDNKSEAMCTVRLDRIRIVHPRDGLRGMKKPPSLPGFKLTADSLVRGYTGKLPNYRRVRRLENLTTGTKIQLQYRRTHGFLKPFRITVIGADATGILWPELTKIGDAFKSDFLITMLELSFDFIPESGIDRDFVLKHGRFGKSRRVKLPQYPGYLRFGTRMSPKMVRCYLKKEVGAYRVELEIHSTYPVLPQTDYSLRCFDVTECDFSFVRMNWPALDAHLGKRGPKGKAIGAEARTKYTSLQRLLRYLRASGVNNPHRFLRMMKQNEWIRQAMDKWRVAVSPSTWERRSDDEASEESQ